MLRFKSFTIIGNLEDEQGELPTLHVFNPGAPVAAILTVPAAEGRVGVASLFASLEESRATWEATVAEWRVEQAKAERQRQADEAIAKAREDAKAEEAAAEAARTDRPAQRRQARAGKAPVAASS